MQVSGFLGGLLAGVLLVRLWALLTTLGSETPCLDIFHGPPRPIVYPVAQLYQDDYGRSGLSHITVAGARHHGMQRLEVWLQTFAPGVRTPVHRHDCEEVFVIQRGSGTALYRAPDGSTQASAFQQNDTLVIPPNLVHQIVNTGQEELQALVVFDSPPVDIWTLANWSTAGKDAVRPWPYTWDRACPPRLPAALQQLQFQQRRLRAGVGAAGQEL